jgi:hypothetical protein
MSIVATLDTGWGGWTCHVSIFAQFVFEMIKMFGCTEVCILNANILGEGIL